jgi:transketolase C-terminal domain/subunit
VHRLKPLPVADLADLISEADEIFVVEENYVFLAKEIAFELSLRGQAAKISSLAVKEKFFSEGASRDFMREIGGVSSKMIADWIVEQRKT